MGERVKEYFGDNRRAAITIFAVIAVLVLLIGLCLSWFVSNKSLSTVGKIKKPTTIKVLGPNETAMEEIPLTYEPTEFADHKVHLTRTFSVVSDENGFTLQLAHTTNIENLEIELYRVDVLKSQDGADVSQVDNDGNSYYWKKKGDNLYSSKGKYLNAEGGLGTDLGNQIFEGKGQRQKNAVPLYWEYTGASTKSGGAPDLHSTIKTYYNSKGEAIKSYVTNFIIDISWTDSAKETDVLYLIAKS